MTLRFCFLPALAALMLAGWQMPAQMPDPVTDASTPLFDGRKLHQVELAMAPEDWAALRQDYLAETYYPAAFRWGSEVVERVGVRSRGNGSRSGVKPALKVAFDKYGKQQRLLGQKSVTLLNMTQDPPMLRDFLSMQLFRRAGVAAPREAYAQVTVNGEPAGLYLMVEAVDTPFLARNFQNSGGWLYDYDWSFPWHFEDLGENPAAYSPSPFQPETNKSNPKPESLVKLVRTLHQTPPERFVEEMSPLVDLDKLLRHVAVEIYLAELDGMLGGMGANNFYLYEPGPGAGPMVFIPWDKSATLCDPEYTFWDRVGENRLLAQALEDPALRQRFVELLMEVSAAAGGEGGWLEETALLAHALTQSAALEDPKKPFSNEEFQQSVEDTLHFIRERNLVMARLLETGPR